MDADLAVRDDAEAIFEADDCPVVESEQIPEQAARAGIAVERTREAMRHPKRALEPRQSQRGRQRDEREVGLRRLEYGVVVRLRRLHRCGGSAGRILRERSGGE